MPYNTFVLENLSQGRSDRQQRFSRRQESTLQTCQYTTFMQVYRPERNLFMELGLVGLGRMGANMAKRLRRADHKVVGFARHASTVERRLQDGSITSGA